MTLTPQQQYAVADAIMAHVEKMDATLPIARCLTAQAQARFTAAMCPDWYSEPEPEWRDDATRNGYIPPRPLVDRPATGERL